MTAPRREVRRLPLGGQDGAPPRQGVYLPKKRAYRGGLSLAFSMSG